MKRHPGHSNSSKGEHLMGGVTYRFRGVVHSWHGGKHGVRQADFVLEL